MLKKKLGLLFFGLLALTTVKAQDPHYSQFYAAPLYLNPGFAGTADGPRVILNHRNQWPGINKAYRNTAFSYDQYMPNLNGGIGIMVANDNQANGVFKATRITAVYSYNLKVNRKIMIKPAISTSFSSNSVNTNNLIWGYDAQGTPIYTTNDPSAGNLNASYLDFGTGAILFSDNFFGGFSIDHLVEPNQSFDGGNSPLPRKYTIHAGGFIPVGKRQYNASISPNILYQQQGSNSQLNIGMYYNRGPIVAGSWYRSSFVNGDSFIGLIGFKYDIYKFGYSYDIITSELRASASGAHEFSFSIQLQQPASKAKGKNYKRVNCPSF